ncbi:PAS domain-containing protein [Oleiagrimonas sp. C23AA]|nr:PAS domain-containing protein [Oleiagrimonas sp. C23AA]
MPRFERQVLWGSALCALPAAASCGLVACWPQLFAKPLWAIVPLALTAWLVRWQFRRVVYPIYSLGSLLESLRQGDYSLRGVKGGMLGDVIYDINALAERLQDERLAFEESSFLLGKTLAAMDNAVMVFDRDGRLRLANPAACELLARTREAMFGSTVAELGLDEVWSQPSGSLIRQRFAGREGRFEVRRAPLRSGGHSAQLMVLSDVGRALREEERAAWQRLLRVLGHEVNNSLAPIHSMAGTLASLLARDPLPDDWREDMTSGLEVIGRRAESLGRFLAGYSRLARLPPPQRKRVELDALCRRVASMETSLTVVVTGGAALHVWADADQLEQALINLLRNAAEAAGQDGEVSIAWRVEHAQALIEVLDDGPGPPPSENLFVPFFTTKPGGSGIGLALVRQIAEAHEGQAQLLMRADGKCGACARLWLPLATAPSTD